MVSLKGMLLQVLVHTALQCTRFHNALLLTAVMTDGRMAGASLTPSHEIVRLFTAMHATVDLSQPAGM